MARTAEQPVAIQKYFAALVKSPAKQDAAPAIEIEAIFRISGGHVFHERRSVWSQRMPFGVGETDSACAPFPTRETGGRTRFSGSW
ncbi:MAG: hypothetical protein J7498_01810 [Sphingobium sp.]|nr:hypothetical protein [Sphingobium sp.]